MTINSIPFDPFQILSLPRCYSLDRAKAESNYLELSKMLHPDRHASASSTERRLALSHAIEVNEAWRTVRDPIQRAEAILRLEGLAGEIGEANEPKPDPKFLMDTLELHEQLAEMQLTKDIKAGLQMLQHARNEQAALELKLSTMIDAVLVHNAQKELLRQVIPVLGQLRYISRFAQEVEAIMEFMNESTSIDSLSISL